MLNNAASPEANSPTSGRSRWRRWNYTFAADVTAAMLCTREVLNQSMMERRSGSIVNISSEAGWNGIPRRSDYRHRQGRAQDLSLKVSARELGELRNPCQLRGARHGSRARRCRATSTAPPRSRAYRRTPWPSRCGPPSPLRRAATEEDVGRVVMFIAGDDAAHHHRPIHRRRRRQDHAGVTSRRRFLRTPLVSCG